MVLKRAKPVGFSSQNYRLKLLFYSNWKYFQVFKIAKFEFGVTVHYGLWKNAPSCEPLISLRESRKLRMCRPLVNLCVTLTPLMYYTLVKNSIDQIWWSSDIPRQLTSCWPLCDHSPPKCITLWSRVLLAKFDLHIYFSCWIIVYLHIN